jgi:2-keto-3-deoxy-L-rhamnonate aldolase RhmA
MSSENVFLKRLRAGEVLLGLNNSFPAAGIIECMAKGWDFIWLDGQHGSMGYDSLYNAVVMCQRHGLEILLRAPGHEPGILGPLADLAPSSIMIPLVNNVEQARAVVSALRFAPLGSRSYGGRRPIDLFGREYYRESELMVVTQVETLEAIGNLDAMAKVEGVDAFFFGPDDMKLQMGIPINTAITDNQKIKDAMKATAYAARSNGKFAGCVAATAEAAAMAKEMGYQIIAGGGDVGFLRTAAPLKLAELKQGLAGATAKSTGPSGVY